MFEFTVAFGFTILAGYSSSSGATRSARSASSRSAVALALLLYASSLPNDVKPLVPALQNAPLLTIHVGMATIAYGIFATSFAAGVGYLVQGQADRFSWLPSHKVLDEVAYRAVIIGFPIFATMIILGSWWASIAWSRYWGWDPKETAALVTWLVYAVYLHARNQQVVGRPAGRAAARRRVRDGPRDLLGQPLVQRPPRLLGAVGTPGAHDRPDAPTGGSAGSSTRSTRGASPTATATASATCRASSPTSTTSSRSGSTRCGCRRSTRRPARRRLRRRRPRGDRSGVRDAGRLRPARGRRPRARARGSILDLVLNHTSDRPPVVRRLALGAATASTPTGTCGAIPPAGAAAGRSRRTTGRRSSAAAPGQWEPAREQFYMHTFLRRAARAELAQPGRPGGPARR